MGLLVCRSCITIALYSLHFCIGDSCGYGLACFWRKPRGNRAIRVCNSHNLLYVAVIFTNCSTSARPRSDRMARFDVLLELHWSVVRRICPSVARHKRVEQVRRGTRCVFSKLRLYWKGSLKTNQIRQMGLLSTWQILTPGCHS